MDIAGVKPVHIKESLDLQKNIKSIFKASRGAGMSGSFFFFSSDNRFLIKTLRGKEKKVILDLLDDFIDYLRDNNNQSLIAKIYGVYTIKTSYFVPVDMIVMENTTQIQDIDNMKLIFDMKGNTFKRSTKLGS